jgi:predicted MFS family arabinose efflux permease
MMGNRFSLIALALGNFVIGLSMLAPAGMMADLSVGFGVTIGAVGLLISLGAAVVCLSPPLVAWVAGPVDRRALLSAVMLWVTVGHLGSALVPNFPSLLAIRLAMLTLAGAFTPLAAGAAALLVSEERGATAISSVLLGWALAIAWPVPSKVVIRRSSMSARLRPTARQVAKMTGVPFSPFGIPSSSARKPRAARDRASRLFSGSNTVSVPLN